MKIDDITHSVKALSEHLTELQEANRAEDWDAVRFSLRSIKTLSQLLGALAAGLEEKATATTHGR